jgi:hypothetical protein
MNVLWGFVALGLLGVGGGIAYFATREPDQTAQAKPASKSAAAPAAAKKSNDEESEDEAEEAAEKAQPAPKAEAEKPAAEKGERSAAKAPIHGKATALKGASAKTVGLEEHDASDAATAKLDRAASTVAKGAAIRAPGNTEPAIDDEPDDEPPPAGEPSWNIERITGQFTPSLDAGLLDGVVETTAGAFLVVTATYSPKEREQNVTALRDITLSYSPASGHKKLKRHPLAVASDFPERPYFVFTDRASAEPLQLQCSPGECFVSRKSPDDPVTLTINYSPCRVSLVFLVPTTDQSEFELRFGDTIIDGRIEKSEN